jgi:hypothetical protein
MFNRQKSFRLIIVGIALVAVTAFTFAFTSGSFNFGTASTEAKTEKAAPAKSKNGQEMLVPLTGTKNIPGDYADLAAAITDLNTQGVGAGGVTFNVIAGNPQTSPANAGTTGGGYLIGGTGSLVLTTTSAANPVTIQGNGNTITAPATHIVGQLNDGIFKLIGADWITITGFTMQENAANIVTTAASNTMTEFGVALVYVTATDGSQNNTITGNTIDLNRTYQNTFGIYSNSTHTNTAVTTSVTATGAAGSNAPLTITANNITDVNNGIVVVGPTAAADNNDGITIGGTAPNANTLTNFGTTGTFSGYANVSGTVNGILVRNSKNFNVSFNSITSSSGASGVTAGTLRGIYVPSASNQPTGTFTNNINNNTLAVTSHVVAGTINGINVESTTSSATSTTNINNNNFTTLNHTIAAASGAITAISQSGSATAGPLNHNINNNTFTNLTSSTTGAFTFISNSWTRPTSGIGNVNTNSIVTAFNKTGAGGIVTLYTSNSFSGATINEINTNNNFSNITVTGATTIAGWASTDGGSPIKTVTGNTFSNWVGGTSTVTGLAVSFSGSANVSNNTVNSISCACTLIGIASSGGIQTFSQNTVHTLTSTGAASVTGISNTGGTTETYSKNKIYDLSNSNAGGSVNGISVSSGTTVNIQNNLIGNLLAAAATGSNAINGINITSTSTSTNINVFFNTVYVSNPTSGAGFGSSGIFHAASAVSTTAALNLRNNIIVNTSVQNGAGLTVAYRRSVGTAGTLANYASTSNNNDFYAGTPSATNLIYYDGTSTAMTIAAYKSGVFTAGTIAPRDSASFSENPDFLSTTGSSVDFLHIDPTTATQIESGAAPIGGITDDFDGNARNVSTPDVGADEFAGTLLDLSAPIITYTTLGPTSSTANRTLTATISDATGVATGSLRPRIYFKKSTDGSFTLASSTQCTLTSGTVLSGTYDCVIDYTLVGGGSVTVGDTIQYFVVAQDTAGTPNVGANPSAGFAATDVNTVTTPPTTPNSYLIIGPPLSGDYTVGTSLWSRVTGKKITFEPRTRMILQDAPVDEAAVDKAKTGNTKPEAAEKPTEVKTAYEMAREANPTKIQVEETYYVPMIDGVEQKEPIYHEFTPEEKVTFGIESNLVGAYTTITGAVADYNLRGIGGHTRFLLIDAAYNTGLGETFPIIPATTNAAIPSASATLTIQPSTGIVPTISGVSTTGIIVFGDPFIKIDGDNVGGGVSRDLTVQNTGTGTSSYVIGFFNFGGTHVAKNGTVRYTNVRGGVTAVATTSWGIILNGAGGDYDDALIENNKIWQAFVGIGNYGVAATGINNNGIIRNNIVGDATGSNESIKLRGIEISQSDNLSVTGNEIFGLAAGNSNSQQAGIFPGTGSSNISITRNQIHDFYYTGTSGLGCFGVFVGANAGTTNIVNNMIHNIKGDGDVFGTSSTNLHWMPAGIAVLANSGTINIDFNSIYMSGATLGSSFTGQSAAVSVAGGQSGINLRNNALRNSMTTAGAPLAGNKTYAVALTNPGAAATTFGTINNNDYFSNGTNPHVGYSGADKTLLTDWQGASTQDAASISADPAFTSTSDLHIAAGPLLGAGVSIAGINNDFDNDLRDTVPEIGADEIVTGRTGVIPAGTYRDANLGTSSLGGDVTITGNLTLGGIVTGGANTLTLDCSATVTGASATNFVVGNVRKNFCAPGAFSFPVGDDTGIAEYSPLDANVTAGTFPPTVGTPPSLTVSVTDGLIGGSAATHTATRYWDVTEAGSLTADISFVYLDADVVGDETSYDVLRRESGTTAVYPGGTVTPATNTGLAPGVTNFSQWAAGNLAPTAANVNIGGRITAADGMQGLPRVKVILSGGDLPQPVERMTNPFGYYTFEDLTVGQTYVITVGSKQYTFSAPTRVITPDDNIFNIDFYADGQ